MRDPRMQVRQACVAPSRVHWLLRAPSKSHPGTWHVVGGWYCEGQGGAACDCQAFKFRSRCSHLTVTREACEWVAALGAEAQTIEQRKGHLCPRCGGPTEDRWFLPETV